MMRHSAGMSGVRREKQFDGEERDTIKYKSNESVSLIRDGSPKGPVSLIVGGTCALRNGPLMPRGMGTSCRQPYNRKVESNGTALFTHTNYLTRGSYRSPATGSYRGHGPHGATVCEPPFFVTFSESSDTPKQLGNTPRGV